MTDAYELDTTPTDGEHGDANERAAAPADDEADGGSGDGGIEESLGVPIPDDHVGAFVAEAFEDTERRTEWPEVVDRFVPAEAREDWRGLSMRERAVEVLDRAAAYDAEAVDLLADISTAQGSPTPETRERYQEALRKRRNADIFRDGVADAYASGRIDDEDLVAAVEDHGFSTETIAEREDELDRVANAFGFEFRPYGGTLFDTEDDATTDDFEAW